MSIRKTECQAITIRKTKRSVAIWRARPEAFTPDLAMSLNNLAAMLSELGGREEAFSAQREATDLLRDEPMI
jgi:hypothetical protein